MRVEIPSGKYVLAVSGGVDSMTLLDLLSKKPGVEVIAAHFNHGIRSDAGADEALVQNQAAKYGIASESGRAKLGPNVSEAAARNARYKFLYEVQAKHKAKAIITAHHQDDLIETAFINLIRGTGRKGLASITSNDNLMRPLLSIEKTSIIEYAKNNNLRWNADSTNENTDYLRNYLRRLVLPKLDKAQKRILISNLDKVAIINKELDSKIANISQFINTNNQINRRLFASLPPDICNELIAHMLRQANIMDFDYKTIRKLNVSLRTANPGTNQPIKHGYSLKFGLTTASLVTP